MDGIGRESAPRLGVCKFIALSLLVLLATLSKPSFVQVFFPAMFLLALFSLGLLLLGKGRRFRGRHRLPEGLFAFQPQRIRLHDAGDLLPADHAGVEHKGAKGLHGRDAGLDHVLRRMDRGFAPD